MRHHRLIPAFFLALGFAAPAWAQRLPQYVAGPFSGFVYDCQQAGQAAPSARSMVLTADLDGDRAPDHVIDAGRGCAANKLLFCGPDGCKVDVYLSTESGLGGSYRARRVRLLKNKLELITDGPACGKPAGADCVEIHGWNGSELVRESIE